MLYSAGTQPHTITHSLIMYIRTSVGDKLNAEETLSIQDSSAVVLHRKSDSGPGLLAASRASPSLYGDNYIHFSEVRT